MSRSAVLPEILSLDPVADHQRIVLLSTRCDFPWDTTRALEFALFRTYCVPSISGLLAGTGEFLRRPQKRYDDTDILVSELMEWGYDSERGRRSLERINRIHGRFRISNEDFLYVLSTFVYEPIRWNARFGWRPLCAAERTAMFHFWREVGRRMAIRAIPESYEEFERFNVEYERAHFRYAESNKKIGEATRDLFLSPFPRFLHPLGRQAIHALMDEPLLDAFRFPRPTKRVRAAVTAALRLRARLLRRLPPRRSPHLRTGIRHPTYPDGYRIEELGPEERATGEGR